MPGLELFELLSYVVTVVGLPLAIVTYWREQRKERENEDAYDDDMDEKQRRRWHSWDDYMREWCRRPDFCSMLPQLLEGEDPDFVACIQRIAAEERACA